MNEHYYSSTIWPYLSFKKNEKILDIIAEGKGVTPYELIVDMHSFFIKHKNGFWEKTEFFSKLKQSTVNDEDYENSKYLYQTLKMRNVGGLNDLYNAQDVILLCEIIENRFQKEKCQKLYLLYKQNRIMLKFLNKRLQPVFSSVNTRLAFDSQILLPNLTNNINLENNPMNKDFNYKVAYNLKIDNEKAEKKSY